MCDDRSALPKRHGRTDLWVSIRYAGEEWRRGTEFAFRDRADFPYSTDAASHTTGNWTDMNTLDHMSSELHGGGAGPRGWKHFLCCRRLLDSRFVATSRWGRVWIRWVDSDETGERRSRRRRLLAARGWSAIRSAAWEPRTPRTSTRSTPAVRPGRRRDGPSPSGGPTRTTTYDAAPSGTRSWEHLQHGKARKPRAQLTASGARLSARSR